MAANKMYNTVCDFLVRDDWRYDRDDDRNIIRLGISLNCKLQSVKLTLLFNESGYVCTAVCPLKADEKSRPAVMEFLTRANYGLRNGNFEFDLRDGEIGYKTYVNFNGLNTLPDAIIKDSLLIPAAMFDRYGDGLTAVLFGFSDAKTEIDRIESDD